MSNIKQFSKKGKMNTKPILFNSEMVRAILAGQKTQTRRIIKTQPTNVMWSPVVVNGHGGWVDDHGRPVKCPYGQVGDTLWVRETFCLFMASWTDYGWEWDIDDGRKLGSEKPKTNDWFDYHLGYKASYEGDDTEDCYWRPSIFMPKWASRITLKIKDIRVERLQDIRPRDAASEGISSPYPRTQHTPKAFDPVEAFKTLWDSINAERGYSWGSNPYVWVVEFEKVEDMHDR